MEAYIATHTYKDFAETQVFATPEEVEAWRQDIAREWWGDYLPFEEEPDDPKQRADAYFSALSGIPLTEGRETFTVEVRAVG